MADDGHGHADVEQPEVVFLGGLLSAPDLMQTVQVVLGVLDPDLDLGDLTGLAEMGIQEALELRPNEAQVPSDVLTHSLDLPPHALVCVLELRATDGLPSHDMPPRGSGWPRGTAIVRGACKACRRN